MSPSTHITQQPHGYGMDANDCRTLATPEKNMLQLVFVCIYCVCYLIIILINKNMFITIVFYVSMF